MKAAILNNKIFEIKEINKPKLEQYGKGAIVRVFGCGLCGSDIVKIRTGKAKDGAVLGHEVIGQIVELNTDVNFKVNDKVVLGHHVPCFNCRYCWHENYSMCEHFKKTNIFPGGFAEYIFVSEEHLKNTVFKVPEDLSYIEASFLEPLACCIRAVKRARIKDNSNALIIGLGTVGLLMGQAVKAFGHKVYGCDILQERVNLSKNYGFEFSFTTGENNKNLLEEKEKITKIGFDTVFLTAGSYKAIQTALNSVRDGGTIIVFSSITNLDGFSNNDIYYRELTVMGSYSPSPMDLEDSMSLLSSGAVNVKNLSAKYDLDKLNIAIQDTLSNKIMKAYIEL